ncbi:NEW3 domain-containing protein [Brachybacterium endophyticum]|nr:NEW3 domain-containing protein [Brachybacterium endophyticum]
MRTPAPTPSRTDDRPAAATLPATSTNRVLALRRIPQTILLALALVLGAAVPALAASQTPRQIDAQVSMVDLAEQDSIQTLSVTITNSSREAMTGTTITLHGPEGWTTSPEAITVAKRIQPGSRVTRTFDVRVPTLRDGFHSYTFTADIAYTGGDGHGSITGERVQTSGEPIASLAAARNNVGTTSLAQRAAGEFDGEGNSFSDAALKKEGVSRGSEIEGAGATFTWPDLGPAAKDNVVAQGQAISVDGSGSALALLASGSGLNAAGTVTVYYTDGTTSTGSLAVPNWTGVGAGVDTAEEVVASAGRNTPDGYANQDGTYRLYAVGVPLDSGKEIEAVQLPANATIHVFDLQIVG